MTKYEIRDALVSGSFSEKNAPKIAEQWNVWHDDNNSSYTRMTPSSGKEDIRDVLYVSDFEEIEAFSDYVLQQELQKTLLPEATTVCGYAERLEDDLRAQGVPVSIEYQAMRPFKEYDYAPHALYGDNGAFECASLPFPVGSDGSYSDFLKGMKESVKHHASSLAKAGAGHEAVEAMKPLQKAIQKVALKTKEPISR